MSEGLIVTASRNREPGSWPRSYFFSFQGQDFQWKSKTRIQTKS